MFIICKVDFDNKKLEELTDPEIYSLHNEIEIINNGESERLNLLYEHKIF